VIEVLRQETVPITGSSDIVTIRQRVREVAAEMRFSLVDQTKLVTAASELARNALDHGGGGEALVEVVRNEVRPGLRLTFRDQGPGIQDVDLALKDGYSTGSGMGLGLGGSKRLSNEFEIRSRAGEGTVVSIVRWR
jgi:serine/threonine-protein kinase RsbT